MSAAATGPATVPQPPPRRIRRRKLGVRGGRSTPCQTAVFNTASAGLGPVTGPGPALRTPPERLPDTARNCCHRAVADKLLGLLAAGLTDGAGAPAYSARVAAFRPTRTLGDPRSSICGDPPARSFPEKDVERPETGSEPRRPGATAYSCDGGLSQGRTHGSSDRSTMRSRAGYNHVSSDSKESRCPTSATERLNSDSPLRIWFTSFLVSCVLGV